jgi:hypothetical protein
MTVAPIVHAHFMVRATAIEMAGALYEDIMRDNAIYRDWKASCPDLTPEISEKLFIELIYPRLLEAARHTLTRMLNTNIAVELKDQIADALIKDQTFRPQRLRREAQRQLHYARQMQ